MQSTWPRLYGMITGLNLKERDPMSTFEVVKAALDILYGNVVRLHGSTAQADAAISERVNYLSKIYSELTQSDRQIVNYSDPVTHFAYLYKYVACHSDCVAQILHRLTDKFRAPIFDVTELRLACLGGGPGSDILGVLKYFHETKYPEPVNKIWCRLLDCETSWELAWRELERSIRSSIPFEVVFQEIDATQPFWGNDDFTQANFFTLSYFISEVMSLDGEGAVTHFLQTIFEEARPGSLFLYIDNGRPEFNRYFDQQWQRAGLICEISSDNQELPIGYNEQKHVLGDYLDKFGHWPKLGSYISYRILGKP